MHYEVSYKDLSPEEGHKKAIEDIKFYLGVKKYEQVLKAAKEDAATGRLTRPFFIRSLTFLASIQGYPAFCFADEVFGKADYTKPSDLYDHFIMETWGDDEELVPFSDVVFYTDQIVALFDNMGKPINRLEASDLALAMRNYSETRDKVVAPKPDPK